MTSLPKETMWLRLHGTTPLAVRGDRRPPCGSGLPQLPPEERVRFRMADGRDGFPNIGIKKAMVNAAQSMGVAPGVVRQTVHVFNYKREGPFVPIFSSKGFYGRDVEPIVRWSDVWLGRALRGSDGHPWMQWPRIEYPEWQIDVRVEFLLDGLVSDDDVVAMVARAGRDGGAGQKRTAYMPSANDAEKSLHRLGLPRVPCGCFDVERINETALLSREREAAA